MVAIATRSRLARLRATLEHRRNCQLLAASQANTSSASTGPYLLGVAKGLEIAIREASREIEIDTPLHVQRDAADARENAGRKAGPVERALLAFAGLGATVMLMWLAKIWG